MGDAEEEKARMTYRGHVEKGAIVLDDPVTLPDGAAVRIELAEDISPVQEGAARERAERYKPFVGALDGLPEDWSENHDRYMAG